MKGINKTDRFYAFLTKQGVLFQFIENHNSKSHFRLAKGNKKLADKFYAFLIANTALFDYIALSNEKRIHFGCATLQEFLLTCDPYMYFHPVLSWGLMNTTELYRWLMLELKWIKKVKQYEKTNNL